MIRGLRAGSGSGWLVQCGWLSRFGTVRARELAVAGLRYGDLVTAERVPRPVIDEWSWQLDGRLLLRGSYPGLGDMPLETVLCRRGSSQRHVFGFRRDGERFTIEIDVSRVPVFGDVLPLRDGTWDIFARPVAGAGAAGAGDGGAGDAGAGDGGADLIGLRLDHARPDVAEKQWEAGGKRYRLRSSGREDPVICVDPRLRRSEQGTLNQRLLRSVYYPLRLRAQLRDAVVFMSWNGKQCADNPRGIADELRRRGDDREHIWAVTDLSVPAPDGSAVVLIGTEDYYEALARSKYLIVNDDMHSRCRKRESQVYLQTWHGTPLKRIGFDTAGSPLASHAAYLDHLARDVAKWDLLLSPSPFGTAILRRAFRFDGEICEYGYPRNDMLTSVGGGGGRVGGGGGRGDGGAAGAELAVRVRQRLELPAGKRVVLYAPTWRDDRFHASGGRYRVDPRLDLGRARRALGDDYVILIRGHHHLADAMAVDDVASDHQGFAVNVTSYPDISELFLVSDLLVTDYSSVMFDYANTGRPMLFFTYDLAEYRDNLRGFYFDFEAEAPGPLLATSDELLAAIKDVDAVAVSHGAAYQAFTAKFCPLDDGKAAARICDRLSRT